MTSSATKSATGILAATTATASNAHIAKAYVTTTPVTLAQGSLDQPIKPVNVVESVAGTVGKGYVCVTVSTGTFVKSSTASVKVASGNGVVAKTVTYPSSTTAAFDVTTASSTTKPSTYVLSGLHVNTPTAPNTTVTVTVKQGSTATCKSGVGSALTVATAAIYTTQAVPKAIYGQTADATAAKLLESRFPATNGSNCPGGPFGIRPVVLATTANFPDALSSQYLAGHLDTGTLLTPTAKLSTVTLQALRTEGITNVYVIGGPLAVSTAVVKQLMTTPAYNCGGVGQIKTFTGGTLHLSVTRIYGQTQYDTAQQVAQSVPTGDIASLSVVGSYAGVNATGGLGKYNQTKGSASAAPSSAARLPTAIVASGVHFQDAMAASAMAYKTIVGSTTGLPVLLTTTTTLPTATKAAIANLGIKQVILMGGQLAVTNSVESALQALGVSVLRIAGATYTETATDLATFELNETTGGLGLGWTAGAAAHTGHTYTNGTVTVSRGNGFTDGLAGAVVSGFHQEPLVLTQNPTTVGPYLTTFLKAAGKTGAGIGTATNKKHLTTLVVFGGPLAVSPAAISAMETDLQH